MRYIEIDSIIEQIKAEHCERCTNHRCALCDIDEVLLLLEEADDADVAEVVRCKDCKACDVIYPVKNIGEDAKEAYFCIACRAYRQPTDFCSYGERKEKMKEKKKAIYLCFSSWDCEAWYECPCCGTRFGSWRICGQEPNENGTEKYCPHCKEELDGLD